MMDLLDLASSTWKALSSLRWTIIGLPLLCWFALSFVVAAILGRMIRKADEAAGVLDDVPEFVPEMEQALARHFREMDEGADEEEPVRTRRREPTRSGPFLINDVRDTGDYDAARRRNA